MRVMGQPVGQGFDRTLQRGDPALCVGQHIGPAREPPGKFIGAGRLRPAEARIIRRLAQGGDQRRLGPFGQRRRLHPKGGRDIQQQLPADSATVVFNKIQIAGRDADPLGKVRLFLPRHHPTFTDTAAGQRVAGHVAPPRELYRVINGFLRCNIIKFTTPPQPVRIYLQNSCFYQGAC